MITPRSTRLHRVADLHAFRLRIHELTADPDGLDDRVAVVPSRAAAGQMGSQHDPIFVTRDELYDRLHARLRLPSARLTALEREIIAHACAREARHGESVRQGLIPEILRFYDQLRRQGQAVSRFEELLTDALAGDAEFDRGAERLLQQTRFLAEAFRRYETRLAESRTVDEHGLRARLLAEPAAIPLQHVVVTVGDWISEPAGLYPADFDLLSRISGLSRLDLVATERVLASGYHERIHQWLPGIEEVRVDVPSRRPTLLAPDSVAERPIFVERDRHEELNAVARRIRNRTADSETTAVAYRKPLPYLYLAREAFGRQGIACTSADGFPLAAEPFAAAVDLILDAIESGFTRSAIVAVLRSPHFEFPEVTRRDISALDRHLASPYVRFLGGIDRIVELAAAEDTSSSWQAAKPALAAAAGLGDRLRPFLTPAHASVHVRALIDLLAAISRAYPPAETDVAGRLERGRRAVIGTLEALAVAYAAHDDPILPIDDVLSRARRAIEAQTFLPDDPLVNAGAVGLMDDHAAAYAEVDHLALVGLVDGDWPERPTRNIFYPTALIAALGWPTEKDRRAAAEARFLDLLGSAATSVAVSTIKLDDETIVEPSPFVDEIVRAGLSVIEPVETDESARTIESADLEWASLRRDAPPRDGAAFHGRTESTADAAWSVSALETYLGCPFKFFAQHVLALEEEPEDEEILDPRRQGELVHRVFEQFFRTWQGSGRGTITPDVVDDARALFASIVEEEVSGLPDTEAALERTRLLGSPVAPGLGDAVFLMEAERPTAVVERLLEFPLKGTFRMSADGVERDVALRGKADRIDLLADGTFRVIDYKLGRAPNRTRALQLPVYGLCAEQKLRRDRGRAWTLGEAAYIAFKEPKRVVPLFSSDDDRSDVLSSAQQRALDAIDRIAAGEFPPTPDDVFRCETCSFASVCRKDYVGDA